MHFQAINDTIYRKILSLSNKENRCRRKIYRILIKLSISIYNMKNENDYNKNKIDKQLLIQIINTELYEQIMYSTTRIFDNSNHDKIIILTNIANSLQHFKNYITSRKIFGIRKLQMY